MQQLGLKAGDRLAILARTCPEWQAAEMAGLLVGGVIVGVDPHSSVDLVAHIFERARIKALVVDGPTSLVKIPRDLLGQLKFVVSMQDPGMAGAGTRVVHWSALQTRAKPNSVGNHFPAANDAAALIYTAGTTGAPKGILFTHAQIVSGCRAIRDAFPQLGQGDSTLCWLPMAHLFQRMMNLVAMTCGVTTYFVEDPHQIMACIQETRPTVLVAVPRFYEKLCEGIQERLAAQTGWQKRLLDWTLAAGRKRSRALAARGSVPWSLQVWHMLLDRLVGTRIRTVLGGNIKFMITGSAPIAPWLLEYMDSIGFLVLEAYGISENTVPIAANRLDGYRFGSVGKPLSENQLHFAKDGEILVKGPGLFHGYENDERGAGVFTADGFYPTGDYGRLDSDGFLILEGRKEDIIKTSTGRRISPARVEAVYRRCPHVDQVVVFGNGRQHLTALVTPRIDGAGPSREAKPEIRELIHHEMEAIGDELASYERVRAFAVLPRALTIADGEITPTLKLCRARIASNHASVIEGLYEAQDVSASNPGGLLNSLPLFTEISS
jgi:long-chain acyl-CoA synthetase